MATLANYIPIVGNFNASDNFSLVNAFGDAVPALSGAGIGPPRKGKFKFGMVLLVGGGPVGDDASFALQIPLPEPVTQAEVDANFNALLPTGSFFYGAPGSSTQGLVVGGSINVPTQTFNIAFTFDTPSPGLFVMTFAADFGWSAAN